MCSSNWDELIHAAKLARQLIPTRTPCKRRYAVDKLVQRVVDCDGMVWYRVRWLNYSAADDTWESAPALRRDGMNIRMRDFDHTHP